MTNKYDDCFFCKGRVAERRVQKDCWWGDKFIAIVDNVPAGVCEQCGERYYRAEVLKEIEKMLKEVGKMTDTVSVPFADFAKAVGW